MPRMWCDVDGKGIDTIHKRIVDLRILTISVPCGISKFLRKAYREVATKLVWLEERRVKGLLNFQTMHIVFQLITVKKIDA